MTTQRCNDADVLSGLVFVGLGSAAIYVSSSYDFGTVARMGPGFFPRLLGGILVLLGAIISARGLLAQRAAVSVGRWRPIIMVAASLVAFGWLIPRHGFAPALLAACVLAMLAIPRPSWKEIVALPLLLCAFCSLIFIYGLGLAIPLAKW